MTIAQALADFSAQLGDALGQHAQAIADNKESLAGNLRQHTVTQLTVGSIGTQIDAAEGRVQRRVDVLERKLDALLRAAHLDPEDFEHG